MPIVRRAKLLVAPASLDPDPDPELANIGKAWLWAAVDNGDSRAVFRSQGQYYKPEAFLCAY